MRLRHCLPAVLIAPLLAGCMEAGGLNAPGGRVYQAVEVADGKVVIRGPSGYCLDGRSLRESSEDGFAVLARCDILNSGNRQNAAALAMLTVTVTPYNSSQSLPSAREMAADMPQDAVAGTAQSGDIRLLHLRTGGDQLIDTADPRHWRAVFLVNGELVSVAAYGPRDSQVADAGGRSLVTATARAMLRASPSE